jgi:hypothetical protein
VKTVARLDETRETFSQIDAISAKMNANDAGTFAIIEKTRKMAHHEENCAKTVAKSRVTPATFAATGAMCRKIDANGEVIYAIFDGTDTSRLSSVSRELRESRH